MSFTNGSLPPPPSSPPPGASSGLPYPWQVAYAQDGRPYYINGNTHETSWTPPAPSASYQPPPPSYVGPPSSPPPAGQWNSQLAAQQQPHQQQLQQRAPDYSLKYPKVHPAFQNRKTWMACCRCKKCTPHQSPESNACAVCGHVRCGNGPSTLFTTWKIPCGTRVPLITKWDCKYPK